MSDAKLRRPSRSPLLTAADAAERLHLSLRSVRRLIKDGKLRVVRIGRAVRIRDEEIEALIDGE